MTTRYDDRNRDYHSGEYLQYQRRYESTMRESDRVIVDLVRQLSLARAGGRLSVIDIGCSTGNLLRHLKQNVPGLELSGGDLHDTIVDACRNDPTLTDIEFDVMDLLDLGHVRPHDVVIVNAVLFLFSADDFERAIGQIARATNPNGNFITFDLFHEVEQDLEIMERSLAHPAGVPLHVRPIAAVRRTMDRAGFMDVRYMPFRIPMDLPRPADQADITSHTVATTSGERLIFRGGLFTPWCHVLARKAV